MNLPAVFDMLSLLILHFVHQMIFCLTAKDDGVHIILCVFVGKVALCRRDANCNMQL